MTLFRPSPSPFEGPRCILLVTKKQIRKECVGWSPLGRRAGLSSPSSPLTAWVTVEGSSGNWLKSKAWRVVSWVVLSPNVSERFPGERFPGERFPAERFPGARVIVRGSTRGQDRARAASDHKGELTLDSGLALALQSDGGRGRWLEVRAKEACASLGLWRGFRERR